LVISFSCGSVGCNKNAYPKTLELPQIVGANNDKKFWSEKDRCHALKNEIVVSLGTYCKIIWVSCGHPGATHDMKIARENSLTLLEGEETLVVDPGYKGDQRLLNPLPGRNEEEKEQNKIMNYLRQNVERMNNRIKIFNAAAKWRGRRDNHAYIFLAICYITNLELEVHPLNGEESERERN